MEGVNYRLLSYSSARTLCPYAMPTPTVSPTLRASCVSGAADPTRKSDPHVRADELVAGLLTLWEEDQVRLTEVCAVAQKQGVLLS